MIFSGKHNVLTDDGYKEINTLNVGDIIITDKNIKVKIKRIIGKPKKPNIIGEFKNGKLIYNT